MSGLALATERAHKISRASLYYKIRDYLIECPPSAPSLPHFCLPTFF